MITYRLDSLPLYHVAKCQSVAAIRPLDCPTLNSSLLVTQYPARSSRLNAGTLARLALIRGLQDGWDEDGAPAPAMVSKTAATQFVQLMDLVGQPVYTVSPGPRGEILVDLRRGDRSLEVLFYPGKTSYVKFSQTQAPETGRLEPERLAALLAWVNAG